MHIIMGVIYQESRGSPNTHTGRRVSRGKNSTRTDAGSVSNEHGPLGGYLLFVDRYLGDGLITKAGKGQKTPAKYSSPQLNRFHPSEVSAATAPRLNRPALWNPL